MSRERVQISELARRAGVPVATVKYYLREGLLPQGELTGAIEALHAAGAAPSDERLDRYAEAAGRIGEQDVAEVPTGSVAEAVRFVVVNTVLLEPVLLALR